VKVYRSPGDSNADVSLSSLFQRGVYVKKPDTSTVSGFICQLFGITPEVLHRDVKTLMLNNRIVDNPEDTELNNLDTVVLSGAMPGLVGAMFRSDSPLKSMRQSISATGTECVRNEKPPFVRVKLFNTVLAKYRDHLVSYGFSEKPLREVRE
jgi:hypothetical protein